LFPWTFEQLRGIYVDLVKVGHARQEERTLGLQAAISSRIVRFRSQAPGLKELFLQLNEWPNSDFDDAVAALNMIGTMPMIGKEKEPEAAKLPVTSGRIRRERWPKRH